MQLLGATTAAAILEVITTQSATAGATYPGASTSAAAAYGAEALLTFGLVSVILGTASGAQNIGVIGALAVGGYIALAGLWGAPLSGASMNPARSFGPDLVGGDFGDYWVYVAGPLTGMLVAVGVAFLLRGGGGGVDGSEAAQGMIDTIIEDREKA